MTMTNPYPWGTQKHKLLARLMAGPILNHEIVDHLRIFNYRDKVSEVRRDLAPQGAEILAEPINRKRSGWRYRLVLPGQQALL